MTVQTYSFLDVAAVLSGPGGSFSVGSDAGVAEEGITIEMVDDKNTMTIGAAGDAMHNLHAGKAGKVTIRLLKTSAVNRQLSQLYALQTSSSALHGQNVLTLQDTARGDFGSCRQGAFKKFPSNTYSKVGPMLEWEFDFGQVDQQLGSGAPALI